MNNHYILLADCKDEIGITSLISTTIKNTNSNIFHLDHYTDVQENENHLYLRIVFDQNDEVKGLLEKELNSRNIHFKIYDANTKVKTALLVSKEDHALSEIMLRANRQEFPIEISCVISNHENNRKFVEDMGIPFHHVEVTKDTKRQSEEKITEICEGYGVDLLVLAKYMQILSPEFVDRHHLKIINIHHSFLPSFIGANPYKQAYTRGVKLIGATSHYVTEDLDAGPIIEQDVVRVNHRYTAQDMKNTGRHVESEVLARAVQWHCEHKVIVNGNKTIVFS
ncbi:formyltetrahydrofolate deformylase [Mammaliicoccus lentus]|jgi:formyltetrahydrofolate deformylase|uniref:Formyltetrahydrofolate deformylase n=1 Tax=Mammaliicoccus lentus TaxID=42858 RepID=A0AAX3W3S9_MAMLE|nr:MULTISPECIES: formyltetrahydrofolate deformylase [Mammaliicoccus]HBV02742.1 formyltetrahydrofolate deformylase [Staphylococcus sp.]MBW0762382.1 formyltetrahydrofolate deformylase [Mammaliicoccus lentus]MBW0767981.1 formyltetrahydrofolate deformylase [Mammaliicoccus lentus]MBW0769545.1 formyltetrahydrofolate deformylase [Mammaliicoccus lentus]MCD2477804.1 formyltetrahydrofolate deformylase [Mammaliicoccus lentus]